MQENLTPTKEKTKKLLKRILAAFLAVVLIATSTMLVDALIVRREALKYRESMGLSAESAKWDRQLVELNEHVESGDYDLALEDVNKAMKKGADKEPGMWLKKAAIEVLLEDYDSALSDIAVSISMDAGESDAYLLKAEVAYTLGDTAAAAAGYKEYLALVPGDEDAMQALAELDYGTGAYREALTCYTQLIEASASPNAAWYLGRASCRAALAEYTFAIQDCRRYLELSDTEAGAVYYLAAVCSMQLGKYEEADQGFLTAAGNGYEPADCYEQSTLCRFVTGDFEGVLETGTALIDSGAAPSDASGFYQRMGVAAMSLEDYEAAAGYLEKAGAENGDNGYYLGVCDMYLGDYEGAVAAFSAAIGAGSDLQVSYYNRGVCYIYQKQYDAARPDLQAAADMTDDESVSEMARSALRQIGAGS
jgi:tetratricopeptide (TPR) repeat protein